MKLPCKVIEDMLPMYYDGVCSEESAALIEEHLKECPHCSHILAELRSDIVAPQKNIDDIKPLKKIQKSYKKMKTYWFIAIVAILLLIPVAFLLGKQQEEQDGYVVEFSQEEALMHANAFMNCLVEGNYTQAYSYWDIDGEKKDLLSGARFTEEDLANFEADGLNKFCQGGEKLESMGGIESFELVSISEAGYYNWRGVEDYTISYKIRFQGKEESFSVNATKFGIEHIGVGDGLIKHPLSHLTLWVQWVVDAYMGQYYDFDLGDWVDCSKED